MKLLTKAQYLKLLANGQSLQDSCTLKPVVKLFTPDAQCTWLLSEILPDDPDIAFGLCDLGMGFPELGTVSFTELQQVRGRLGLPVERDLHFKADKTLIEYADSARNAGFIKA